MAKIGFIGAGVMGSHMIRHLVDKGHDVRVYSRTKEKVSDLAKEIKIQVCDNLKDAVIDRDYVITIVGYPKDVREVYLSKDGILENASRETILIDMTTSEPSLAVEIYEKAKEKGMYSLDAPVSGGDKGAKNATLSIMVGGDLEVFNKALDILKVFGNSVTYMGKCGNGQHTKACNQICVAGATSAYTEAIIYAKHNGLDVKNMFDAIRGGAAGSWQIDNMAPRALSGDLDPGFFIHHFIKDMNIIENEMKKTGVELKMLKTVLELYKELAKRGYENMGTQGLLKYYDSEESEDIK